MEELLRLREELTKKSSEIETLRYKFSSMVGDYKETIKKVIATQSLQVDWYLNDTTDLSIEIQAFRTPDNTIICLNNKPSYIKGSHPVWASVYKKDLIDTPVSTDHLKAIEDLLIKLKDFKVRFFNHTINIPDVEKLRTLDDCIDFLGDCNTIHEEEVWHMGWDIQDNIYLLEKDNKLHIFYSTDAHGGYLNYLLPDSDLNEFNCWASMNSHDYGYLEDLIGRYNGERTQ